MDQESVQLVRVGGGEHFSELLKSGVSRNARWGDLNRLSSSSDVAETWSGSWGLGLRSFLGLWLGGCVLGLGVGRLASGPSVLSSERAVSTVVAKTVGDSVCEELDDIKSSGVVWVDWTGTEGGSGLGFVPEHDLVELVPVMSVSEPSVGVLSEPDHWVLGVVGLLAFGAEVIVSLDHRVESDTSDWVGSAAVARKTDVDGVVFLGLRLGDRCG